MLSLNNGRDALIRVLAAAYPRSHALLSRSLHRASQSSHHGERRASPALAAALAQAPASGLPIFGAVRTLSTMVTARMATTTPRDTITGIL